MRIIKAIKIFGAVVMVNSLSACSMLGVEFFGEEGFFRDRQGDYLEADSIPRIVVPDTMDSYIIDDLLVIPTLNNNAGEPFVQAPRPRPLQRDPDRSVVVQSMNEKRWAVVDASVSQVWPRVRQYWLQNGVELALENPANGLLETTWFIDDGNNDTQQKVRVLVEPGFQDESAEVSLIQIAVPQNAQVNERVTWPEESMDPDYASDVLNEISVYLANEMRNYQASTVSFLAGNMPSTGKATMLTEGGINMLHLRSEFDRAWAAVGRAIERAGVEIIEENIEEGMFSVAYGETDVAEESGLMQRMLSTGRRRETIPFGVFLVEVDTGVEVVALRMIDVIDQAYSSDLSEEALELQEQQDIERINSLIQTIRDLI